MDGLAAEARVATQRQASNTATTLSCIDALLAQLQQTSIALDSIEREEGQRSEEGQSESEPSAAPWAELPPAVDGTAAAVADAPTGSGSETEATEKAAKALRVLKQQVRSSKAVALVTLEHKSFHAGISRLSKAVARHTTLPLDEVLREQPLQQDAMTELLVRNMYHRGYFETADMLAERTGMAYPEHCKAALVAIHEVLRAMQVQDLGPARQWLERNRTPLERIGSTLDLQLVRLAFLLCLETERSDHHPGGRDTTGQSDASLGQQQHKAVLFAQENFPRFASTHMKEVQELMACMLWAGRLGDSPYAHLLGEEVWTEACHTLIVDGCTIAGLPRQSALTILYEAGMLALPIMVKMAKVVRSSGKDWNSLAELLPVEIPLDASMLFHSNFTCPISREQATPDNPPVLLTCGHVICQNSLRRIARIAEDRQVFKCPTCPREQREEETKVLYL